MQATARILRQDAGPNIAAVEFSGWDTHANQGVAGGALNIELVLGAADDNLPGGRANRLSAQAGAAQCEQGQEARCAAAISFAFDLEFHWRLSG